LLVEGPAIFILVNSGRPVGPPIVRRVWPEEIPDPDRGITVHVDDGIADIMHYERPETDLANGLASSKLLEGADERAVFDKKISECLAVFAVDMKAT
jgi:hypothetical protein